MDIAEAFEIVLALARAFEPTDGEKHVVSDYARRNRIEACDMIEDLAVNEYGDD